MTEQKPLSEKKHLYWIIGLIIIVCLVCGTLIYINNNSWIISFEMDDNTLEAIKSINWSAMK
jgi:flagellar basal body-associated protein FliL